MATCVDNPALGIIGCGATFGGERQHSVARVSWSDHPDGRAHITGALTTIDKCWKKGKGDQMAHPAKCGFTELRPGYWGTPAPAQETGNSSPRIDETAPEVPLVPPAEDTPVSGVSGDFHAERDKSPARGGF